MFARSIACFLCALHGAFLTPHAAPGMLLLRNTKWERVVVEARVGGSVDCQTNPTVGTQTLLLRQSWAFAVTENVCWRRERIPGDSTSGWTSWSQARVGMARREINL